MLTFDVRSVVRAVVGLFSRRVPSISAVDVTYTLPSTWRLALGVSVPTPTESYAASTCKVFVATVRSSDTYALPTTCNLASGFTVPSPTELFSASTCNVSVSTVRFDETYALPATCNLAPGDTVPTPTELFTAST